MAAIVGRLARFLGILIVFSPAARAFAGSGVHDPGGKRPQPLPQMHSGIAPARTGNFKVPTPLQLTLPGLDLPPRPGQLMLPGFEAVAPEAKPAGLQQSLGSARKALNDIPDAQKAAEADVHSGGVKLQEALQGEPDKAHDSAAPAEASLMVSKFARKFQLGKAWQPPAAKSPELRRLSRALKRLSRSLNKQFEPVAGEASLKSSLLAAVNHDYNNQLATLKGWLTLLKSGEVAPAEQGKIHAKLMHVVDSMADILDNFMELGRVESGRLKLNKKGIDLGSILKRAVELRSYDIEQRNLNVILELPEGPLFAMADPNAVERVVSNLLGNAIKYTPDGGKVTVGAALKPASGKAVIFFEDSGIGIPVADQQKIFQGYYRTEAGKKTGAKGHGIGLFLVKKLIEASGSKIEVNSEPGNGSRFSFELPLSDAPAAP